MKLSVLIPAHNEVGCLEATISDMIATLSRGQVCHEIHIVDDNSSDGTLELCRQSRRIKRTYVVQFIFLFSNEKGGTAVKYTRT